MVFFSGFEPLFAATRRIQRQYTNDNDKRSTSSSSNFTNNFGLFNFRNSMFGRNNFVHCSSMPVKNRAVGIDLGTTYSCVGVWTGDKVEILTNSDGNRTTPSYVSFGDERLIGDAAKNQAARNPLNTVYDAKRLLGRKFDDPEVQQDMKLWGFKVEAGKDNDCMISVKHQGKQKKFRPEEISAMVLSKMKSVAEEALQTSSDGGNNAVTQAVITVPAYFSDAQRQATKGAGTIAGLEVLRIINEPTAAAIAYGLDKKNLSKVLVYDMGGGTFDVSLLEIEDGVFEVKATAGDTRLGGEDFTSGLMDVCYDDIKKRFGDKKVESVKSNPRSQRKLWQQCENAKRTLSNSQTVNIEVDSLFENDQDYSLKLSRSKFEADVLQKYIKKSLNCVDRVLKDAKIERSSVDEIVLIGGSTRIPGVQKAISDYFGGKEPNKSINPDEAVAYGAAIQAAILSGAEDTTQKLHDLVLVDVTPLSLGLETAGGVMTKLINRNSTIPTKKEQIFSTFANNQTSVDICVYEGERAMAKDCNKLGNFRLDGIAPAPRGVPQIQVSFDLDPNGILNVNAMDKASGKKCHITITNEKGRMSKKDIEQCINDAEKYKEEDEKIKLKVEARNSLESYIWNIDRTKMENEDKFEEEERSKIEEVVRECEQWLNQKFSDPKSSAEEIEKKQKEVEKILNPIMVKYHGRANEDDSGSGGDNTTSDFTEEG